MIPTVRSRSIGTWPNCWLWNLWVFYCCLLELLFWLLYYSCSQCAFLPAAAVVFMLLFPWPVHCLLGLRSSLHGCVCCGGFKGEILGLSSVLQVLACICAFVRELIILIYYNIHSILVINFHHAIK